jgi:hypothetical protein
MKASHTSGLTKPNRDIHYTVRMRDSKFDLTGKEINTVPKAKMGASGATRAAIGMDLMLISAPY